MPERITIERIDDLWRVSDEDGFYAASTSAEGLLPYVHELLVGPGTADPYVEMARLLDELRARTQDDLGE